MEGTTSSRIETEKHLVDALSHQGTESKSFNPTELDCSEPHISPFLTSTSEPMAKTRKTYKTQPKGPNQLKRLSDLVHPNSKYIDCDDTHEVCRTKPMTNPKTIGLFLHCGDNNCLGQPDFNQRQILANQVAKGRQPIETQNKVLQHGQEKQVQANITCLWYKFADGKNSDSTSKVVDIDNLVSVYSFMIDETGSLSSKKLLGFAESPMSEKDSAIKLFDAISIKGEDDYNSTFIDPEKEICKPIQYLSMLLSTIINKIALLTLDELCIRLLNSFPDSAFEEEYVRKMKTPEQYHFARTRIQSITPLRVAMIDGQHRMFSAWCIMSQLIPSEQNPVEFEKFPEHWELICRQSISTWIPDLDASTFYIFGGHRNDPFTVSNRAMRLWAQSLSVDVQTVASKLDTRTLGNVLVRVVEDCKNSLVFNNTTIFDECMTPNEFSTYLNTVVYDLETCLLRENNDPGKAFADRFPKNKNDGTLIRGPLPLFYFDKIFMKKSSNFQNFMNGVTKHRYILMAIEKLVVYYVTDDESNRLFTDVVSNQGSPYSTKLANGFPVDFYQNTWCVFTNSVHLLGEGGRMQMLVGAVDAHYYFLQPLQAVFTATSLWLDKNASVGRERKCPLSKFCLNANLAKSILKSYRSYGCFVHQNYFRRFFFKDQGWLQILYNQLKIYDYQPILHDGAPTRLMFFIVSILITEGMWVVSWKYPDKIRSSSHPDKSTDHCRYRSGTTIQDFEPVFDPCERFFSKDSLKLLGQKHSLSKIIDILFRECWLIPTVMRDVRLCLNTIFPTGDKVLHPDTSLLWIARPGLLSYENVVIVKPEPKEKKNEWKGKIGKKNNYTGYNQIGNLLNTDPDKKVATQDESASSDVEIVEQPVSKLVLVPKVMDSAAAMPAPSNMTDTDSEDGNAKRKSNHNKQFDDSDEDSQDSSCGKKMPAIPSRRTRVADFRKIPERAKPKVPKMPSNFKPLDHKESDEEDEFVDDYNKTDESVVEGTSTPAIVQPSAGGVATGPQPAPTATVGSDEDGEGTAVDATSTPALVQPNVDGEAAPMHQAPTVTVGSDEDGEGTAVEGTSTPALVQPNVDGEAAPMHQAPTATVGSDEDGEGTAVEATSNPALDGEAAPMHQAPTATAGSDEDGEGTAVEATSTPALVQPNVDGEAAPMHQAPTTNAGGEASVIGTKNTLSQVQPGVPTGGNSSVEGSSLSAKTSAGVGMVTGRPKRDHKPPEYLGKEYGRLEKSQRTDTGEVTSKSAPSSQQHTTPSPTSKKKSVIAKKGVAKSPVSAKKVKAKINAVPKVVKKPRWLNKKKKSLRLRIRRAMTTVLNVRLKSDNPIPVNDANQTSFWKEVQNQMKSECMHWSSIKLMSNWDDVIIAHPMYRTKKNQEAIKDMGLYVSTIVNRNDPVDIAELTKDIRKVKIEPHKMRRTDSWIKAGGDNIRNYAEDWDVILDSENENWQKILKHRDYEVKRLFGIMLEYHNENLESDGAEHTLVSSDILSLPTYNRVSFLWSGLKEDSMRQNSAAQDAHCDYDDNLVEELYQRTGLKPVSILSPLTEDGQMLRVWSSDHKRSYLVFVPMGVSLYVWADIYHAGGYCYGENDNDRMHHYIIPGADTDGKLVESLNSEGSTYGTFYITPPPKVKRLNTVIDKQKAAITSTEMLWCYSETEQDD